MVDKNFDLLIGKLGFQTDGFGMTSFEETTINFIPSTKTGNIQITYINYKIYNEINFYDQYCFIFFLPKNTLKLQKLKK